MLKNIKIRTKFYFMFSFTTILSMGLVSLIGFFVGGVTMEEEAFNKLKAVREIKKNQINTFFKDSKAKLASLKNLNSVSNLLIQFDNIFKLDSEIQNNSIWLNLAEKNDIYIQQN